jgi:NAD-dependent SIR2 family protein deacetylase
MTGVSERGMHGSLGVGAGFGAPLVLTVCDQEARPGYATMQAHEYQEDPSTFRKKIQCLGELIRRSQHFVAYTGAGISTASGIDDYASQSKQSVATGERAKGRVKRKTGLDAEPTFAHFTLAALYKAGRLKHWVQQNHDGLPQKAGFPQQHINEIHGAWFDPSNPVVPMDGSLRSDLCAWMEEEEQKADLVLAMGSSLCGMNADRMVDTPNRKAARGKALGAVIVGYQRTQMDESCALRIFANIDETMLALALELSLPMSLQPYRQNIPETARVPGRPHAFSIPYATTDGKGYKQDGKKQILDLRPGARLILTGGPGVGFRGVVRRVPDKKQSTYSVQFPSTREGPGLGKSLQLYALGAWMIEAACKGTLAQLPVTNDPTPPPPLCDISESFDNINQLPSLLVLMENSSKKTKDAITAMLHDLAQAERKLPEAKRRVQCFFTACGGGPAAEIRRGCKLPPCPPRAHSHPLRAAQGSSWRCDGCQCDGAGKPRFRCAPCDFDHCGDCKALVENTASEGTQSPMMVILNMPQNGAFFRPSVNLSTVTSTNVGLFLDAFKLGSLTRQQFGG